MKGDFSRNTFHPARHYRSVLKQQGRVDVDADWNEQQAIQLHRSETATRDVIGASGAPLHSAGFHLVRAAGELGAEEKALPGNAQPPELKPNDFLISAGRFYVDGLLCENERMVSYTTQPDLPDAPPLEMDGFYLAYLDVWQRHITALDDPLIREKALGGPDTATRLKTVWQVKILPLDTDAAEPSCGDDFPAWTALTTPPSGTLNARTQPGDPAESPCLLPPSAGYQRLENQLYRVEIHEVSTDGRATFKWSRDNGSVVTAVEAVSGSQIVVADLGPDEVLGFSAGQWVEWVDDRTELHSAPGVLLQIASVDEAARTISTTTPPPALEAGLHPKLRRWDQTVATANGVAMTFDWQPLEDGVQVRFSQGSFRSGDYWTLPARTATGEIEWPPFQIPNAAPLACPPFGIRHHYSRLAILQANGEGLQVLEDCRPIFPPLTELPSAGTGGFQVKDLRLSDTELGNDADVPVDLFNQGLQIVCTENVAAESVQEKPVCTVTLDLPFPSQPDQREIWGPNVLLGTQPMTLAGAVRVQENVIFWQPSEEVRTWLQKQLFGWIKGRQTKVLAHLRLRGNFIWAEGKPDRFLDGEVFGKIDGQTQRTGLRWPSGDQQRGSDLQMWFWLVQKAAAAPALLSLKVDPARIGSGGQAIGSIELDHPSPAGGTGVNVASSDPDVTLPAGPTVNVPAGKTSAEFPVAAAFGTQRAMTRVTITATLNGASKTALLTVLESSNG